MADHSMGWWVQEGDGRELEGRGRRGWQGQEEKMIVAGGGRGTGEGG